MISGLIPLIRISGLTPRAEIAATALCIESSPMCPEV